ncbi:purine nucleosidase [Lachnospiraceae bacterium]|uniref:nucleoside hydrolase n=1 Tax=Extibacter sp. GGCC_0201 TaxID=2731209 RepID=UPI001AA15E48|nr:nucleoside hydrolase [Extibacter sp. GGCC_0201]MBO1719870.1 nucleoside hydrolase [Extibacter sp. GGCC_0201]BDF35732.1 purine nucleosidase [Lachnospiraceae bacterium]BDF39734.1 purine nucleosidase [Lachnospiraceae bacterium]
MKRIIIDTDPGIDDAFAILLALAAKEKLEVLALTTVNGNAGVDQVTKNACKICDIADENELPIFKGCSRPLCRERENSAVFHGDDGLGNIGIPDTVVKVGCEHAVDYLVRKAREEKGEITLTAIGPLTNIAAAIKKDAEFAGNVKELVIMGGAEFKGNMSPHAEFNFWVDPEAAKIVFAAGFGKITMIGLDATAYIYLDPVLRELLYAINTPVSRFMHKISRVYMDGHWKIEKKLGCELCDVLTIAYLLDESVVEKVDAFVDVETKGLCEGASVVYRKKYYPQKEKNCEVAVKADVKHFYDIFFKYLFPEYLATAAQLLTNYYDSK